MTIVARDGQAHDRLADFDLSYELVERALLRADAEAKLAT
jgi:hypothetical protein